MVRIYDKLRISKHNFIVKFYLVGIASEILPSLTNLHFEKKTFLLITFIKATQIMIPSTIFVSYNFNNGFESLPNHLLRTSQNYLISNIW